MLFEKDGTLLEVTDQAHIDCLKAKCWNVVASEKETTTHQENKSEKAEKKK